MHLPDKSQPFYVQAGIAVDFFFLLSGFVLAHTYEERLRVRGTLWSFLRDRVRRRASAALANGTPAA